MGVVKVYLLREAKAIYTVKKMGKSYLRNVFFLIKTF
jgi:hypothetical protein